MSLQRGFRLDATRVKPADGTVVGGDGGVVHHLEPKTMDVLLVLAARSGEVVSKTELIDTVWQDVIVAEGALSRRIHDIRKALGESASDARIIQTIPKRGYRLNVDPVPAPDALPLQSQAIPPSQPSASPAAQSPPVAGRAATGFWRARRWLFAAGFVLVMAACATWAVSRGFRSTNQDRRSAILVMPFANLSDSPENDSLAEGITNNVITQLSKAPSLTVIAPLSRRGDATSGKRLLAAGEELGITAVLSGSVHAHRDRVCIFSQLVDISTDEHIWAETFDRGTSDLFTTQADVSREIAGALKAELVPDEMELLVLRHPAQVSADDWYRRGVDALQGTNRAVNESAVVFFQRAIRCNDRYAPAHAGLAQAYCNRVWFGFDKEWCDRAVAAAETALAIEPDLPEALSALGFALMTDGRCHQARQVLLRLRRQQPEDVNVLFLLAYANLRLGRHDQAAELLHDYIEVAPCQYSYSWLARNLGALGLAQESERWIERADILAPNCPKVLIARMTNQIAQSEIGAALSTADLLLAVDPTVAQHHELAAFSNLLAGRYDRARELAGSCLNQEGFFDSKLGCELWLAACEWQAGDIADARVRLGWLTRVVWDTIEQGADIPTLPLYLSVAAAIPGDREGALTWLTRAVDAGETGYQSIVCNPVFGFLLADEGFQYEINRMRSNVEAMRRRVMARRWFRQDKELSRSTQPLPPDPELRRAAWQGPGIGSSALTSSPG